MRDISLLLHIIIIFIRVSTRIDQPRRIRMKTFVTLLLLIVAVIVAGAIQVRADKDCTDHCIPYANSVADPGSLKWINAKLDCEKSCACLNIPNHPLCKEWRAKQTAKQKQK